MYVKINTDTNSHSQRGEKCKGIARKRSGERINKWIKCMEKTNGAHIKNKWI